MNFRTKLLLLNFIPLLVFAAATLIFGLVQFRSSLYNETEGNLRSTALAALTLYSTQGYGDYKLRDDGHVWRGMNFNVSEKTSIVDDMKRQTGIDITFYYNDTAAMTSIEDANKTRSIGMKADENIKTYILGQGKQLWCREIRINGKSCQAYVIPIRQESDDDVVGALMASQSASGFHATIRTYVMSTLLTTTVILFAVFFFIRRHVEWFAQKFSEVTDRSRQDLLTGLYNKLTFETETGSWLAKRKAEDIATLLILDFDNFKHVNDNFGHQTGDEALKAFAAILLRTFRSMDIIGRVGGDEFMVFMPGMTRDNVKRSDETADEILSQLRELRIGKAGPFSCSIGIGTCMSKCSFQELYQIADKALYEAKERGKACFVRRSSEA